MDNEKIENYDELKSYIEERINERLGDGEEKLNFSYKLTLRRFDEDDELADERVIESGN